MAECGHCTVVVGSAPLAVQVGKAVDQNFRPGLPAVFEEQFFAGFFALSVFRCAETAGKCGLNAGTEHHRASVPVFLKGIQQGRGESEIALHELLLILRTVDSGQIEHEVAVPAPSVQIVRCGVEIIFVYFRYGQVAVASGLAVLYVVELCTQILSYEAFCSGYQYLHLLLLFISCLISSGVALCHYCDSRWSSFLYSDLMSLGFDLFSIPKSSLMNLSLINCSFMPSTSKRVVLCEW